MRLGSQKNVADRSTGRCLSVSAGANRSSHVSTWRILPALCLSSKYEGSQRRSPASRLANNCRPAIGVVHISSNPWS
jgi:hypothetical protein